MRFQDIRYGDMLRVTTKRLDVVLIKIGRAHTCTGESWCTAERVVLATSDSRTRIELVEQRLPHQTGSIIKDAQTEGRSYGFLVLSVNGTWIDPITLTEVQAHAIKSFAGVADVVERMETGHVDFV